MHLRQINMKVVVNIELKVSVATLKNFILTVARFSYFASDPR